MTKVKLPKEVAEAIEYLRNVEGCSNSAIMKHVNGVGSFKDVNTLIIRNYATESDEAFDEVMSALVNGYEVEKSPEDKLREYIESNRVWIDRPEDYAISERQRYVGRNQGVMMTLSILGITIEGING